MKIQKLIVISFALLSLSFANALEIVDVTVDHWASQEIIRAIQNNYIQVVDQNKFQPEGTMTRSEFVNSLLKVINRQNEKVVQDTSFKDVQISTPNQRSIKLSEQIAMAFGYPDKTFKPTVNINHNETMSMIANITNGEYVVADITGFKDYAQIPLWAKRAYIKNVANGIYVNYPDGLKFNPTNDLTRAEAAVLFDRIAANLDKVKDSYKDLADSDLSGADFDDYSDEYDFNKSTFLRDETLAVVDFATNDKVKIYDNKKIIEAGNILVATSLDLVKSRKDLMATEYVFAAPNDIYTKEGTLLFPKGTEFYVRVDKIGYSAWRSKPEKSRIVFHKYSMPNGETYDMAGVPFTKKDRLIYTHKNTKKSKALAYYDGTQKQNLINVAHQMAPLMDFDILKQKTIYILITGDTVIPADGYTNFRTKESVLDEEL